MFNLPAKDFYGITTAGQIETASRKVFSGVLEENPVKIDENGVKSFHEYADMKLDGLNPDDEIVGKFFAQRKGNVLCVIVRPAGIRKISSETKFYINFYNIQEKNEGKIYEQVLICSGFGACIIGQGSPREIAELERSPHLKSPAKVGWAEMCLGSNKKKLGFVSALILAGVAIFLKKKILF